MLAQLGYSRAGDVVGGFEGWREAGLPIVAPPEPPVGRPGMGDPA
jgi:hypothetical protein